MKCSLILTLSHLNQWCLVNEFLDCRDHLAKEESVELEDLKEAMAVMDLMDIEENQVLKPKY